MQLCAFCAFWEIETVTDLKNVFIQVSWENLCDVQPKLLEFAALSSCLVTSDPLCETTVHTQGVGKTGHVL